MRLYLFTLLGALLCFACTQDEFLISDSIESALTHRITMVEAQKNAISFVQKTRVGTRSSSDISIGNSFAVTTGRNSRSSAQSGQEKGDTLYYVINFSNEQGFVVASADNRQEKIFAYVPKGNLSSNYRPKDSNNGFDVFMSNIEYKISRHQPDTTFRPEPVLTIDEDEQNYPSDYFEKLEPQLLTNWGQSSPYNLYNPNNRGYTGCVVTAVCQICSYLQIPRKVSYKTNTQYGGAILDWPEILRESQKNGGILVSESSPISQQVAHLMRFWGGVFDADYKKNGTGVDSEYAISKMKDLGINMTNLEEYNGDKIIEELGRGNRIAFVRGNTGYSRILFFKIYNGGHAWVVDGYIRSRKDGKVVNYLHCNWGWEGLYNGYFLTHMLYAGDKSAIYDRHVGDPESHNYYKYNLEQSIVQR